MIAQHNVLLNTVNCDTACFLTALIPSTQAQPDPRLFASSAMGTAKVRIVTHDRTLSATARKTRGELALPIASSMYGATGKTLAVAQSFSETIMVFEACTRIEEDGRTVFIADSPASGVLRLIGDTIELTADAALGSGCRIGLGRVPSRVGGSGFSEEGVHGGLLTLRASARRINALVLLSSTTLGLDKDDVKIGAALRMEIYPNVISATGLRDLLVEFVSIDAGASRLSIYSAVGTRVHSQEQFAVYGSNFFSIDTRMLPAGMYWAELRMNAHTVRQRFVILAP